MHGPTRCPSLTKMAPRTGSWPPTSWATRWSSSGSSCRLILRAVAVARGIWFVSHIFARCVSQKLYGHARIARGNENRTRNVQKRVCQRPFESEGCTRGGTRYFSCLPCRILEQFAGTSKPILPYCRCQSLCCSTTSSRLRRKWNSRNGSKRQPASFATISSAAPLSPCWSRSDSPEQMAVTIIYAEVPLTTLLRC